MILYSITPSSPPGAATNKGDTYHFDRPVKQAAMAKAWGTKN
ncbi:MAG: hypothetical protein RBJ76_04675 [Stenomitos frigidus ULC029]